MLRTRVSWDWKVDTPVLAALAWGFLLTVLVATNGIAGTRAVGTYAAGWSIFLFTRSAYTRSENGGVYLATCWVLVCIALVVLLEAFGVLPFFSEPGRRPGGTLGNRNLVARILCLSLPLFWRQLLLVEKPVMRRILAVSVMLLVGAIVLSRSRGAWLVSAGLAISLPTATWLFFNGRSTGGTRDAVRLWTAAIVIGVAAAVFVPNRLGWGFADFASSAERLLDLEDGTGRGRLIQSVTTLRMIEEEPLLGVGPGNWGILYPAFARSGDPSLTPESIYPAPHQPRGDLLSLTAEFGLPGLILMMAATWGVICRALVMRRDQRPQVRYSGLMVIGLVASTIILGMSDPIVRLSP